MNDNIKKILRTMNSKNKSESESERNTDDRIESHKLEEWKMLNEYVNKLELDHTAKISIVLSGAIIGLATILSNGGDSKFIATSYIFAIIPITVIGILAYTVYQFKNIEIARGYLKYLEKTLEIRGKSYFLWNTEVRDINVYGKRVMPVITFIALFAIEFFCVVMTKTVFCEWSCLGIFVYWLAIIAGVIGLFFYYVRYVYNFSNDIFKYYDVHKDKGEYITFDEYYKNEKKIDFPTKVWIGLVVMFNIIMLFIAVNSCSFSDCAKEGESESNLPAPNNANIEINININN